MKRIISILSVSLFLIALIACDKYDEGGAKKKAEANLTAVWEVESYLLDGADKTSDLLISNFNETFADDGTYTRFYTGNGGVEVSETGSWTLVEDNTKVNFSGAGAVELTAVGTTVSTSSYTIKKLTKKALWYSFESGGAMHEFHMKAK